MGLSTLTHAAIVNCAPRLTLDVPSCPVPSRYKLALPSCATSASKVPVMLPTTFPFPDASLPSPLNFHCARISAYDSVVKLNPIGLGRLASSESFNADCTMTEYCVSSASADSGVRLTVCDASS